MSHTKAWFVLLLASQAWALPPQETWVVETAPAPNVLELWRKAPGTRHFVANFNDPGDAELNTLLSLPGAEGLDVVLSVSPSEASFASLARLAAEGARLTVISRDVPTDYEIELLDRLPLKDLALVIPSYPTPPEAQRLNRLALGEGRNARLVFAVPAYPRYADRPGLEALSSRFAFTIATAYWPGQFHMNVLNLLPQELDLRIRGMDPPAEAFPYLTNLKRLHSLMFERTLPMTGTLEQQKQFWARFLSVPVRWTAVGHAPDAVAIQAFESQAGALSITVDRDGALDASERARLAGSRLPTRWIHRAPDGGMHVR